MPASTVKFRIARYSPKGRYRVPGSSRRAATVGSLLTWTVTKGEQYSTNQIASKSLPTMTGPRKYLRAALIHI
jgi:hypothetical protein